MMKRSSYEEIKEKEYENKKGIPTNMKKNSYQNSSMPNSIKVKKEQSLFLRKEIFDHAIIYTTPKMEESILLHYLRNFYEYFKYKKNSNSLNDEICISFDDWSNFNDDINNQDNVSSRIFSIDICKSLWILLSITLQCVRKKNNQNKQKTLFNSNLDDIEVCPVNKKKEKQTEEENKKEQLLKKYDKSNKCENNERDQKKKEENESEKSTIWGNNWQNEYIQIELVIFFILLQFHKIDPVKKKYERNLSEDCWPNYLDSPRSVSSNSSFVSLNTLSTSLNRQNLSDFFSCSTNNYKTLLKSYLTAFLTSTDIVSSSTLLEMPLYFKNYNFYLLDFIIDTNNSKNVYESFLVQNEYKILHKTKDILQWLLKCLHVQDGNVENESLNISNTSELDDLYNIHLGIEKVNNDIYEIKNLHGKALYIHNGKNIININNCKECNIFILTNIEYLKINLCVDCYIICLSVEMITTLFNSNNIDLHVVSRNLKIENTMDTNIYVYTETNLIISGDTRNIQLAPYNILCTHQKKCLDNSKITFNEKNCKLYAYPLNCKSCVSHSLNLSNVLKTSVGNMMNMGNPEISKGSKDNNLLNISNDKKVNISNKTLDGNILANSFTDYVYYLLNPSCFFLIELTEQGSFTYTSSSNQIYSKETKKNGERIINEYKENEYVQMTPNEYHHYNIRNEDNENLEKNNHRNFTDFDDPQLKNTYNRHQYVNNEDQVGDKYTYLYLPDIYKNAIENQDDHIISFLNFMNTIQLSTNQKQKIIKILTLKLFEYTRKYPKILRSINDMIMKEQDFNGTD